MMVYISDAISGARPGARYENYEEYVQRLEKLETIATEYPEVDHAFAIQAGREIRVILIPEKSKDDDVQVLAMKIRDRVKNEMTYPGTVTVTVIRETRNQQVAT
jgi:ribonuclease Y